MASIFNQVIYNEVDRKDWDNFINQHFPELKGEYRIVDAEELSNDTVWRLCLDASEPRNDTDKEYHTQDIAKAFAGDWVRKTRALAYELMERGILAAGNYLIEVCW